VLVRVIPKPRLRGLLAVTALALCAAAMPATASAVEYEVTSTGDEPDATVGVGGCLTAGLVCSLRAAIQESNASAAVDDTIKFAPAFNGQLADTIVGLQSKEDIAAKIERLL